MSKAWLVTGSASGLGGNIAEAVLASGDRLVATARDPGRLEDLMKKYGDEVRTAPLDVADEAAAYVAVQVAIDAFGRLDLVVNNADYGDFAPFEQLSSERFKAVVDTNFYGVVNVTRAALPIMRKQKSGCILQISSVTMSGTATSPAYMTRTCWRPRNSSRLNGSISSTAGPLNFKETAFSAADLTEAG
jgi:NAD(P)-dependent dehydrogenase (short-subunit alcohol dehydrogenase family)